MRKCILFIAVILFSLVADAQKKPLDHSVYDGWQNIGERGISNDGKYVFYTVNPQEGDGVLVIQASDNSYKKEIPRGYNALVSEDSRYLVFKIRPFFKDTREARIKKKKTDEMPKDSLGIVVLGKDSIIKIAKAKSYKMPEKAAGWLAYHLEKSDPASPGIKTQPDSLTLINNLGRMADSLVRVADSLRNKATEARKSGLTVLSPKKSSKIPAAKPADESLEEGTDLVLRNLNNNEERKIKLVSEYFFAKKGNSLLIETTRKKGDTLSKATVLWMNLLTGKMDTVMSGFNDAKNYAMDEDGEQLAFVAERDSVSKALVKFFKLWYYKPGMDSARLRADKNTNGIVGGLTISPDYINNFSKDGKKLFVGLSPVRPPRDTTLIDFETARLDIWHYGDDYLQSQQLVQLQNELKRSYVALATDKGVVPLADENCESVLVSDEGNGAYALGTSTKGYRIQQQWEQAGISKLYLVNVADGTKKTIADKIRPFFGSMLSPKGKFVIWYDWKKKQWITYNTATGITAAITTSIKTPLFDEEDDQTDDPSPHGLMGWHQDDKFVYIYDRYDIWQCDPSGITSALSITNGLGRQKKYVFRNNILDREERFIKDGQSLLLRVFDEKEKRTGWKIHTVGSPFMLNETTGLVNPLAVSTPLKAKNASTLLYAQMSPSTSPNLFTVDLFKASDIGQATQLSNTNPQQKNYLWHTVELHKWKMLDGKMSEGLLFKPENFDSTKKYPIIFYFYERNADTRYSYRAPAPSASTINIAYFTSNGYLVFDPNIYYKNGEPGESAVNSVVSAANYLKKMKWVDSAKMAIQGQSWGGYQVAYIVTRSKLFAAAGAGAAVSNMTSAYGGIRWGTGINRQFQYERSQSRIGATLWQRRDLYIKNSPLFHADKITTPLLLMHNDKDGAVPWYQGIEFFTALRRLNKKAWLLQYNEEDHNLVERRNRKDLSVRLAQFFDHYLKSAPAPEWMTEGVPASLKGIDWGLKTKGN
jgi:dipeptidyl aminopeptidase/acylaminoacyl peptidase